MAIPSCLVPDSAAPELTAKLVVVSNSKTTFNNY